MHDPHCLFILIVTTLTHFICLNRTVTPIGDRDNKGLKNPSGMTVTLRLAMRFCLSPQAHLGILYMNCNVTASGGYVIIYIRGILTNERFASHVTGI